MREDPIQIIVLNNLQTAKARCGRHNRVVDLLLPIAQQGGGELLTHLGTVKFDLIYGVGDALILFSYDQEPVAVGTLVWEPFASNETWSGLIGEHAAVIPPGIKPPSPFPSQAPDHLPWMAITVEQSYLGDSNLQQLRELLGVMASMAQAILRYHRLCSVHN